MVGAPLNVSLIVSYSRLSIETNRHPRPGPAANRSKRCSKLRLRGFNREDFLDRAGELLANFILELCFPTRHGIIAFFQQLVQLVFDRLLLIRETCNIQISWINFDARFVLVVEKSKQTIELLLLDRIKLVIVALGAADRESQPDGSRGCHAVEHAIHAKLLSIDATFLIDLSIAVESSRHLLADCGVGQQIARELLDRELIEAHVRVECFDDPIPILPDRPRSVDRVPVAVGVPRLIKPPSAPSLAVMRAAEQAIDQLDPRTFGILAKSSCLTAS